MKKKFIVIGILTFVSIMFYSFKLINTSNSTYVDVVKISTDPNYDDYKTWYQITKGNPNTGDPTGFLSGKHRGTKAYREIYINSIGEATHKAAGDNKYPVGTIIVKEAFKNKESWEAQKSPQITIMVKLNAGESVETGDWGYIMGAGGKMGTGTSKWAKFCGSCHVYAAAKDYAFINSDFMKSKQ